VLIDVTENHKFKMAATTPGVLISLLARNIKRQHPHLWMQQGGGTIVSTLSGMGVSVKSKMAANTGRTYQITLYLSL